MLRHMITELKLLFVILICSVLSFHCGLSEWSRSESELSMTKNLVLISIRCDADMIWMHVVQQLNMEIGQKTYLEKTLLFHFHAEKPYLKVRILQHKFLNWK